MHCTHGHNRTGYMIIHFLMRTQQMSVTQVSYLFQLFIILFTSLNPTCKVSDIDSMQAIKIFADARPPGIYKPDYIDALYSFYHEKRPEMVVCPSTPEWKKSTEFDLNGDAVPDDDDDGVSAALPLVSILNLWFLLFYIFVQSNGWWRWKYIGNHLKCSVLCPYVFVKEGY